MKKLEFRHLWDNYPSTDSPCSSNGKPNFSNQCAIRVGVALAKSGVDLSKVSGVRHCWHHPKKDGHVLNAEELASGLDQVKISGLSRGKPFNPKNFKSQLAGKTGVIFFKDYWQRNRDAEGRPTGDHIDLWNESRLTDWTSWLRVQLGIVLPGFWSDLESAKTITFWEIK